MRSFLDIPYRVIVYDILSYFLYYDICMNELDLFGYFKLDKSRKIFQIFLSVKLKEKLLCGRSKTIVFSPKNTEYLELITSEYQYSAIIDLLDTSKFRNLESFKLCGLTSRGTMKDLFSRSNGFPKVKNLSLELSRFVDPLSWHESNIWNNLRTLDLSFSYISDDSNFHNFSVFGFHSKYLINLENLKLSGIERKIIFNVPNVKTIVLKDCSQIEIFSGEKVKVLRADNVTESRCVSNICFLSKSLETLDIADRGEDINNTVAHDTSYEWMFQPESLDWSKIRHVELFGLYWPSKYAKTFHFGENLKYLEIEECPNFKEIFSYGSMMNYKYKYLTHLTLYTCDYFYGDMKLPFCQQLKFLDLIDLKNLSEDFFRKRNFFRDLETLKISECNIIGDLKWKKMPSLKYLKISKLELLRDSFFELSDFSGLERLKITRCSVNGEKWSNSMIQNIKCLKIVECVNIGDSFFGDCGFHELRKLSICGLEITGKGWKKMGKLRDLKIVSCRELSDILFQTRSFRVLEKLVFRTRSKLFGVKWKYLPNLAVFDYRTKKARGGFGKKTNHCMNFCKGFRKNNPFPKNCFVY